MKHITISRWIAALATAALSSLAVAQVPVDISFYYPVAVGGPITKIIDKFATDFEKENPGIKVHPIYSGTYQDSITKALTAVKSNDAPAMSVLLSTDMYTLIDEDAIVPWDPLIRTAEDKAWLQGFYPAFMENSQTGGKTWGIPFQRSTIVLYYNKEMFKEAGLDPNHPPETWKEMAEYAQKLTKRDASGKVAQWGVQIPASGFPYWLFQGLTTENGVQLMNAAGTETYYDKPAVIEAVQYWVDLTAKYKAHPEGIVEWGTTPKDFFERKVAMMWTTTGNLTNVRSNAKFDFGVAMLPANKRRGSPTGGGNFYLFKQTKPEQQAAAFKFVKWITSPARAAQWGIDTGYVAVRPDAWETPEMKKYVAEFPPAAVARDQLQFAVAELSTHDNQRVTKALNDGLQAALTGSKSPEQAMKDAQREADRLLKSYRK
ncbi:MAG TPA: ABC transporter substrate-binding protein [Casimicrobiaceae bacterium]|jgi:sn-glycerol 3-phosphate transport system substrate-binding protein|nr:ABC transporter substrate-binding protein [Casimicrobiaceae bacterium]